MNFHTSGFHISGFHISGFHILGFNISVFRISGFCILGFCISGFCILGFHIYQVFNKEHFCSQPPAYLERETFLTEVLLGNTSCKVHDIKSDANSKNFLSFSYFVVQSFYVYLASRQTDEKWKKTTHNHIFVKTVWDSQWKGWKMPTTSKSEKYESHLKKIYIKNFYIKRFYIKNFYIKNVKVRNIKVTWIDLCSSFVFAAAVTDWNTFFFTKVFFLIKLSNKNSRKIVKLTKDIGCTCSVMVGRCGIFSWKKKISKISQSSYFSSSNLKHCLQKIYVCGQKFQKGRNVFRKKRD